MGAKFTVDTASNAATVPEVTQRLEITDMSFYHSPRSIADFAAKKDLIEGIFTIPARVEFYKSWPFGPKIVIQLAGEKFVKGVQREEKETGN